MIFYILILFNLLCFLLLALLR